MSVVTELQVADLMARGILASPAEFKGSLFVSLRVSGTGVSFRPSVGEWVWRDASVWLAPTMQNRVRGLPLLWRHPRKGVVDGGELRDRIIGTMLLGFRKGHDLFGIARVVDKNAAELLRNGAWDTSPAIIFGADPGRYVVVGSRRLLLELIPALFDHVCITEAGVWGLGRNGDAGVDVEGEKENAA